jgi:uncharacterized protein YbaP (TraB family)
MGRIFFIGSQILLITVALMGPVTADQMYIWKDPNGHLHFSDRPPPEQIPVDQWISRPNDHAEAVTSGDHATPAGAIRNPAAVSGGLFWKIDVGGRRPSYLLGTIHSDDQRVLQRMRQIDWAFDRAERFVMEVVMDDGGFLKIGTRMILTDGRDLESLLGAADYRQVVQAMARYGMPEAALQRMKPWAVMAMLSIPSFRSGQFLDLFLYQKAVAQGKTVFGLESVDEQLAVFENLSMADQLTLLKLTIKQLPEQAQFHDRLMRSYLGDDLQGLSELVNEYQRRSGNAAVVQRFMKRLNDERNFKMAQRVEAHLAAGNAFIAVGALHLLGKSGLLAQLRQRGYQLSPVRF